MSSKKSKQKSNSNDSLLSWLTHIGLSITYGVLFMFLIANILYSQFMPDQYFSLLRGEDAMLVEIFQKGKESPYFLRLFPEVNEKMAEHESVIYADTHQRRSQIDIIKQSLEQNPESRDLLYALYILYKQEGQRDRAQEYLDRARQIDPTIGLSSEE